MHTCVRVGDGVGVGGEARWKRMGELVRKFLRVKQEISIRVIKARNATLV